MKQLGMTLALVLVAGCMTGPGGGGGNGPVETSLVLDEGLGTFDVQAGVPETRAGTVQFSLSGGNLTGGTLALDPDALNVTQAKGAVALQGGVLTVTVRVAAVDQLETVCASGEEYGPFEVTLDEANAPTAVDPDTVELSESTLTLLEAGEFSICIEVISPIDGSVSIRSFNISLNF